MKQLAAVGLVVLIAGPGACARGAPPEPAVDVAQDKVAIGKTLEEYAAAWKVSDAPRLGRLYTEDATILPGDHVAENGVAAIVKYNQEFFNQFTPQTFDISPQESEVVGDWAFSRGAFSFSAQPKAGGPPLSDRGKYIIILKRQADGSWKWLRDMDNSDGMTAPAATSSAVKSE